MHSGWYCSISPSGSPNTIQQRCTLRSKLCLLASSSSEFILRKNLRPGSSITLRICSKAWLSVKSTHLDCCRQKPILILTNFWRIRIFQTALHFVPVPTKKSDGKIILQTIKCLWHRLPPGSMIRSMSLASSPVQLLRFLLALSKRLFKSASMCGRRSHIELLCKGRDRWSPFWRVQRKLSRLEDQGCLVSRLTRCAMWPSFSTCRGQRITVTSCTPNRSKHEKLSEDTSQYPIKFSKDRFFSRVSSRERPRQRSRIDGLRTTMCRGESSSSTSILGRRATRISWASCCARSWRVQDSLYRVSLILHRIKTRHQRTGACTQGGLLSSSCATQRFFKSLQHTKGVRLS